MSGIQHALVEFGDFAASVYYIRRRRRWYVFWPWPSFKGQSVKRFKEVRDAMAFARQLVRQQGRSGHIRKIG